MKKILAFILMLSMVVMLSACGGGAGSYYADKYDYIADLAKAMDAEDDDRVDEICDEIADYWEDYRDKSDLFEEEMEEKYEDDARDMEDLEVDISDADISDGARDAIEEAMYAAERAISLVSMMDYTKMEKIAKTMMDVYRDCAKAAKKDDSDKVKEIARDAEDEFEAIVKEYEDAEEEYNDKINELRDEYGDDIVNQAISKYNQAMYY